MDGKIKKTVIINRAVPGSGKTTITNCIVAALNKNGISSSIHSTDNFFMTADNRYAFDVKKLYGFHLKNLHNFKESLAAGVQVVICDNINIAPWQTLPYTDLAREYSYQVIMISFEPRELSKHIECQIVTEEKPDAHNVPEKELKRFILEYYIYNPLLDSRTSINEFIHKDYEWNTELNFRQEKNTPSPYFDLDNLIVLYPNEYHAAKISIGETILKLLVAK